MSQATQLKFEIDQIFAPDNIDVRPHLTERGVFEFRFFVSEEFMRLADDCYLASKFRDAILVKENTSE